MRRRLVAVGVVVSVVLVGYALLVIAAYRTIPTGNTSQSDFDAIIVLGYPSLADGSPSPDQRSRVLEGVAEYRRHVADHIIMTGGAAHNEFVEAHTMAVFAESLGVPAEAIIEEGQAHNTIENIFYSKAILDRHGWSSVEVVSAPSHLPRAALILSHWRLAWHTHPAALPPEDPFYVRTVVYTREALECWRLRSFGFPPNKYLPEAR